MEMEKMGRPKKSDYEENIFALAQKKPAVQDFDMPVAPLKRNSSQQQQKPISNRASGALSNAGRNVISQG
jgi:hypothetical protein